MPSTREAESAIGVVPRATVPSVRHATVIVGWVGCQVSRRRAAQSSQRVVALCMLMTRDRRRASVCFLSQGSCASPSVPFRRLLHVQKVVVVFQRDGLSQTSTPRRRREVEPEEPSAVREAV